MKTSSRYLALTLLLAAACIACPSCGLVEWGIIALTPPKKIKPQFVPPEGKRVLVFVDDKRSPVSYEPLKRELTEELNKQLIEHKLAASTVSYERLLDVVGANKRFNELYVADVGNLTGADLVLHVEITGFQLKRGPDDPVWDGKLITAVRWVDCHAANRADARLWPKGQDDGMTVGPVGMPPKQDPSLAYGAQMAKGLAQRMADKIAKLFHEYEVAPESTDEE